MEELQLNESGEKPHQWCLVGNIIDQHTYGEPREIRRGTKHFRPGAKVYLFPEYGGVGHERIVVIGRPRHRRPMIRVVIQTKLVKNIRLEEVYIPWILQKMAYSSSYSFGRLQPDEVAALNNLAKILSNYTEDIASDIVDYLL